MVNALHAPEFLIFLVNALVSIFETQTFLLSFNQFSKFIFDLKLEAADIGLLIIQPDA